VKSNNNYYDNKINLTAFGRTCFCVPQRVHHAKDCKSKEKKADTMNSKKSLMIVAGFDTKKLIAGTRLRR